MKVSDYIAEFLAGNQIETVFTVVGGGAMHLNDALGHHPGLQVIYNHHEQASSIAAEAYSRMTGKLPAVCVTSGPGGTNAITGVLGAWVDSIPMLVLSGQVKREVSKWACPEIGLRQLGDQEYDIVNSVSNMTKYAVMVTDANEIAYHLEKAVYLAGDGRGGPVWIDIPLDIQGAQIEPEELRHFTPGEKQVSDEGMGEIAKEILSRIQKAKAPLILAGGGIRLGDGEEEFLKLVDKLKIPVVTAWNSTDTLAYDSPYFAGMPGTVGTRPGNFAVQNCDLLLSLGCRLNLRMIGYNRFNFAENAYKIIVDIDEKELQKPTICPDMPIHADVKAVMRALLKEDYCLQEAHEAWAAWCRKNVYRYPAVLEEYHKKTEPVNPYVFTDILFQCLKEDDRIICGNGSACVITFQAGKIKQGQRMFTNSGCAAMGYGLPAALGVAVSDNRKRTICIDGDGSIMMNLQELSTIACHQLNIKIFVINNNGYHSIRQTQENHFQPPFVGVDSESGLQFPDFAKLSEAFGIRYYHISKEEEAEQVVNEMIATDVPCLCEVLVDAGQSFAPKASSKVLEDGSIISPSIEDMAPFLDKEELDAVKYRK